jgi:hypothetical protein
MTACSTALAEDWGPAQFLVGHWTGDGSGQPGNGSGAFSFTADLAGHVLIRKSFAEYPAANGRPASRHDDLTIVYRDESSRELKAIYFDSEGHVIRYRVSPSGAGVVFLSEGDASQVRYRLTYTPADKDSVKIRFEIAAPGKDFTTYIDASSHRD